MTKKVKVEIQYTREYTFSKTVEVSEATANRLLGLNGEDVSQGKTIGWDGENEDDVSTDDFTMIAEDLTSIHDVMDAAQEITDFQANKA